MQLRHELLASRTQMHRVLLAKLRDVDGNGTPLNVILTGTNRHDSTQLMPLLDGMAPIAGRRGHRLAAPVPSFAGTL